MILRLIAVLFLTSSPAFASDIMLALDECEGADPLMNFHLAQVESLTETARDEQKPLRLFLEIEIVRWHKTRCVQNTLMRFLPADVCVRIIEENIVGQEVMTEIALYRGVKSAERDRLKCKGLFKRFCPTKRVAEDMQRLAVLTALDQFTEDYEMALTDGSTLHDLANARLKTIEERIRTIQELL